MKGEDIAACTETSMAATTGSKSPSSPSSPPPRRSRSRFQFSSTSSQRRRRSWSPRSPSPSSGQRSRSRSWSPSFKLPTTPSTSLSNATVVTMEEAKTLYMFFWFTNSPIAYGLYAINMPNPTLPLPPLQPCNQLSDLNKTIYPILELRAEDYPERMCCVELESKLYLLGGICRGPLSNPLDRYNDDLYTFPTDVFVLNLASISTNTHTTTRQPSELLRKGTAMNAGKVYPYAFVAHRKIYALGTARWVDLPQFEVFDLESNNWSLLPNHPIRNILSSHALVDKKVFLATRDGDVFSYDLDTSVWVNLSSYSMGRCPFYGRGEFVEDTIYAIYSKTVTAIRPTCGSKHELRAKGVFERVALMSRSSGAGEVIGTRLQTHAGCPYLIHLGNRIFCYVLPVGRSDPKFPQSMHSTDDENLDVSIITFEALQEIYVGSSSGEPTTFFQTKLIRNAQYVARSKGGACLGSNLPLCCCMISTIGTKLQGLRVES
ncbi:hypothetical protein Vadar_023198 [Vaccinium darrowii]|uniref:Uncharacterized protein n=1 Tax=Vaccinium darrowii TaxID=229202 RepID=A0ACB7YY50_9ERIC|nr:hypothetical protein Vadar_023198 [Vaccinium darrowii]